MSSVRLLITDLDNTLYDWVTYYASAFEAMKKALVPILDVDEETILDEFKALHLSYGSSEHSSVVFELPTVKVRFGALSMSELREKLQPALVAFNRVRQQSLHLYESVGSTLQEIRRRSVVIVGHTEAIATIAYYRLSQLNIVDFFQRLYAIEGHVLSDLGDEAELALTAAKDLLRSVPRSERKPNARLLQDICYREGFSPSEALYVGDSLTRDISMANAAGVISAWAEYGTHYEEAAWRAIVRISHWTDDDIQREKELGQRCANTRPDFVVSSFDRLLTLEGIDWGGCAIEAPGRSRDTGEE